MVKISALIITFNEEKKVGRCIDSLVPVADEIIVVDSYSTDNTRAVCESRNIRFIQHPFEGHIQQKNFALSQATHNLVLSLDADEYLSEELQASILSVKQNPASRAWSMNRLSSIRNRWIRATDWYPDRKIRLWYRESGRWGGYNPHDHVILAKGERVQRLKGPILHEAYDSYDQLFKKAYSYAVIYARANAGLKTCPAWIIPFKAWFSFVNNYLLKRGIFYGFDGYAISKSIAVYTFTKYTILLELNAALKSRKVNQDRDPSNG